MLKSPRDIPARQLFVGIHAVYALTSLISPVAVKISSTLSDNKSLTSEPRIRTIRYQLLLPALIPSRNRIPAFKKVSRTSRLAPSCFNRRAASLSRSASPETVVATHASRTAGPSSQKLLKWIDNQPQLKATYSVNMSEREAAPTPRVLFRP